MAVNYVIKAGRQRKPLKIQFHGIKLIKSQQYCVNQLVHSPCIPRAFKAGNFGDCVINEIFQFPDVAAATN
jgi:hypothetical protein